MKRYNNLFDKIVSMENLCLAHKNARKGKISYMGVKKYDSNPEYYLGKLQKKLMNKTFTTSEYKVFTIYDKGKERVIHSLPYEDRVVHWAVMQIVEPIFMSTFINQTYAALPKRGIHKALKQVDNYMVHRNSDNKILKVRKEEAQYCLKIDVKKFFPNVNQEILKTLVRRKFKDKDFLWLMDNIIESLDTGLPIGNYTSQFLGNFYLSYFDHWLKEEKKIKMYCRYMDDCVIFHEDKEFLHNLKIEIEEYLKSNLDLELKENWQVFPTFKRGVDFVGYRHFGSHVLLRKSTTKTLKRKMSRLLTRCKKGKSMSYSEWCSVNSYKGWIKFCNGEGLLKKYIEPLDKYCKLYYLKNIKNQTGEELKTFKEVKESRKLTKRNIKDILGEEIVIKSYTVKDSKFSDKNKGKCLRINYEKDGKKYFTYTGSNVLIEQLKEYGNELPFKTIIMRNNKYYKLV